MDETRYRYTEYDDFKKNQYVVGCNHIVFLLTFFVGNLSMVVSGSLNRRQVIYIYIYNPPIGSIYHLYIASCGVIICYLPPFKGTRNSHWIYHRHHKIPWFVTGWFQGPPRTWDPLLASFPYYSHTIPISSGILMGTVWEAYQNGVPLLGVPKNPIDLWLTFVNFARYTLDTRSSTPAIVGCVSGALSILGFPWTLRIFTPQKIFSTRVKTRDFYIAVHILGTRKSEMG